MQINKTMRTKIILVICLILIIACKKENVRNEETFIIPVASSVKDVESIQKIMAQNLFDFYSKSNKTLSFYEVLYPNFFLLNYNPAKKTLSYSTDLCSGWSVQYMNVSLEKLNDLAKLNLPFDKYDSILEKQTSVWGLKGDIPTNGCMGY